MTRGGIHSLAASQSMVRRLPRAMNVNCNADSIEEFVIRSEVTRSKGAFRFVRRNI